MDPAQLADNTKRKKRRKKEKKIPKKVKLKEMKSTVQ